MQILQIQVQLRKQGKLFSLTSGQKARTEKIKQSYKY